MVIQSLRYHVECSQKGWVKALPQVRFDYMNTVHTSTSFSPFQLRMGRAPRIIPPLVSSKSPDAPLPGTPAYNAHAILCQLKIDTATAQDNLLLAKVQQAIQADKTRGPDPHFKVGDLVMLNTLHRRRQYMQSGDDRVAKFMPHWDGRYKIIAANPSRSSYPLELPNQPLVFPTFHASELKRYIPNDSLLFPDHEPSHPPPLVTADSKQEWQVDRIMDERRCINRREYLVRWKGYD